MNAYFGSLKIYEVLAYVDWPSELAPLMGERSVMVRFGSEEGTPLLVRMDDIEIY